MARRHGIDTLDLRDVDDLPDTVRGLTAGRGPDSVIDAVGMEAHGSLGSGVAKALQTGAGLLPDALARPMIEKLGVDRLGALHLAISTVRRGGTVSLSGVYGGAVDPMPMMELFDKQVNVRMGQANVRRWIDDLMPLVSDPADPLGVLDLRTHRLPLEDAPRRVRDVPEEAGRRDQDRPRPHPAGHPRAATTRPPRPRSPPTRPRTSRPGAVEGAGPGVTDQP